jgi:uncharacterized repeat protein (TIGR04138 family)
MRQDAKFWEAVNHIRETDGRFGPEAYSLVMESLDFTMARLGEHRHVTAGELLEGLCAHAKRKYGVLALAVVQKWGIRTSSDVGRIVYQLVEAGVLRKQESDRFDDFDRGCDLEEKLEDNYFD